MSVPGVSAPFPGTRRRLPNRRAHDVLTLEHDGRSYTVGLGFFADSNLAEIFLNSAKIGTDLATADQDAAVVLSLALQHGCPVETIRRALARNPNGTARGVIGVILDRLAAEAEG